MNRFLPLIGLLTIGLLIPAAGCRNPSHGKQHDKEDGAVTKVNVIKVEPKTLTLTTTQPAHIEAFEQTPMFTKIEGYVSKVRNMPGENGEEEPRPIADIGDQVKEGDVLAEILVPEMEQELKQKEALLAQAQAGEEQAAKAVLVAKKAVDSAQARVAEAKAGVLRVNAEYERWKSEHDRISKLAASGSVTQQLVEEKLHQFKAAEAAKLEVKAKVDSAEAAFGEAEAHAAKVKADEAAAKARADVAQADLNHVQAMLDYTLIRAPFNGVITQRNVDTGHFVRPPQGGAKPLFVIARLDKLRVVVNIPEKEAALVNPGSEAVISAVALGGNKIKGTVTRTSWALDPATRTLRAEIDLQNKNGKLRPGLYTTVQITLKQRPDVLAIPFKAVVNDGGKTYCCRVESDKVVREEITLGLRVGEDIEVVSGLKGTPLVVREYAASLKHGQAVEVIDSQSK